MRRLPALLVIVPAFGCAPNFGHLDPDGGGGGSSDVADEAQCFGSFVTVCFKKAADVPKAPKTLSGEISTNVADASQLCDTLNDQAESYCVVAGAGLTIASGEKIRAHGSRPLILLSTAGADLSGDIDVSSTSAASALHPIGAGAGPTALVSCEGATAAGGNSGGFGGSFSGRGGDGEGKDGGQGRPAAGTNTFPLVLRGGCQGGNGSTDSVVGSAGTGGHGGGAVAVIANTIQLNGKINASGAGGHGGPAFKSGAGGGGSGGMIVLEATSIAGAGLVFANGGAGGQGGSLIVGAMGGAGADGGESTGPTVAGARGFDVSKGGGKGGDGSFGTSSRSGDNAGGGSSPDGGGGAGGGGAGFIRAYGMAAPSVMMAPPSTIP